jgi:hypothetical protein
MRLSPPSFAPNIVNVWEVGFEVGGGHLDLVLEAEESVSHLFEITKITEQTIICRLCGDHSGIVLIIVIVVSIMVHIVDLAIVFILTLIAEVVVMTLLGTIRLDWRSQFWGHVWNLEDRVCKRVGMLQDRGSPCIEW